MIPFPKVVIDNTIEDYGHYYDEQRWSTYGNRIIINKELCQKDNILMEVLKHELSHHLMAHMGVPSGEEQVAHFIITVDEYFVKFMSVLKETFGEI